jgi:hypothetical protein
MFNAGIEKVFSNKIPYCNNTHDAPPVKDIAFGGFGNSSYLSPVASFINSAFQVNAFGGLHALN